MKKYVLFHTTLILMIVTPAIAAEHDEFKVKREAVFDFEQKPRVTQEKDNVTIEFTTKGFCDCTIVIEDTEGQIVRHLASGVLGPKAPAPFQPNTKSQKVVWDGKDDRGVYIDDTSEIVVRVSLGLKPRFERTLFWSPHKRVGGNSPRLAAAPEGVYLHEGCGVDHVRLFDHDGNYIRTVYPFPRGKLGAVKGIQRAVFPQDGKKLPLKHGPSTSLRC